MNNGITPQKAIDIIRGTEANDYKDGVLNVSRSSASMIVRTITNGVSNEARLVTLDENEDVLDGIQFLTTLDGRTSFICASLDGKIWRGEEMASAPRPPLHPNCRSTIIPYIELRDENGNLIEDTVTRPAATGPRSYQQVSASTTFKEYFENQPEEFQRSWLGSKRFELYKDGKLKFENLVKPDSGYIVPVSELNDSKARDTLEKSPKNGIIEGIENSQETVKNSEKAGDFRRHSGPLSSSSSIFRDGVQYELEQTQLAYETMSEEAKKIVEASDLKNETPVITSDEFTRIFNPVMQVLEEPQREAYLKYRNRLKTIDSWKEKEETKKIVG